MPIELNASSFVLSGGSLKLKNKTGEPGMLLIHANWCGHCQTFKPVYAKLDSTLNSKGTTFPLFMIEDQVITKKLAAALNVRGYPTIKFVDQSGNILDDYKGGRDVKSLLGAVCETYHKCME